MHEVDNFKWLTVQYILQYVINTFKYHVSCTDAKMDLILTTIY